MCTRAGTCERPWSTMESIGPEFSYAFPQPTPLPINAVYASVDGTVWAAGARGVVLRGDGVAWDVVEPGNGLHDITVIDGSAADNVWIGSEGTALRFDGTSLTDAGDAVLNRGGVVDLAVAGPDSVWALSGVLGLATSLRHWDGAWSEVAALPVFGVSLWAVGEGVWIIGADYSFDTEFDFEFDKLVLWDGVSFTVQDLGGRIPLAVLGASSVDVHVVTQDGAVGARNGTTWAFVEPVTPLALRSAGRARDGTWWAMDGDGAFYTWEGSDWRLSVEGLRGTHAGAWVEPGLALAVIDDGTVARFDGAWRSGWQHLPTSELRGVAVLDNDDVWTVGRGGCLVHWDSTQFDVQTSEPAEALHAIHARAADDLWVAATGAVLHGDGESWTRIPLEDGRVRATQVWASPAGPVWLLGVRDNAAGNEAIGSVLLRGDTAAFAIVAETDEIMTALWGVDDEIFVAGEATLRRFGGDGLKVVATFGVEGQLGAAAFVPVDRGQAWLAGHAGLLWRFDGTVWRDTSLPTVSNFRSGFAAARDDVWLLGDDGLLAHWDGALWTPFAGPYGSFSAMGGNRSDMWLVGGGGIIATRAR